MILVAKNETVSSKEPGRPFVPVFLGDKAEGSPSGNMKYLLINATVTNDFPIGVSNEFIGKREQHYRRKRNPAHHDYLDLKTKIMIKKQEKFLLLFKPFQQKSGYISVAIFYGGYSFGRRPDCSCIWPLKAMRRDGCRRRCISMQSVQRLYRHF